MSRSSHFVIGLFLVLIFRAEAKKDAPLPPPPPMAQPYRVSIYRGQSVDIPLAALGRAPSQLKFLIRSRPQNGQLGEVRVVDEKNAVVTYTASEKAGDYTEDFSFAVQAADSPVSASAQISIIVSEEPSSFRFETAIDFGRVVVGKSEEKEITLANAGGGTITGSIKVSLPWKISGSPVYRLGRHSKQAFTLVFTPAEGSLYAGSVTFSHDPSFEMEVSGVGVMPFQFEPADAVELAENPSNHERTAAITVRNLTDSERTLRISLPPHVIGPSKITIAALGETRTSLRVADDFVEGLEGDLNFADEDFSRTIAVRAFALEPRLSAQPREGFLFGKVEMDHQYKAALHIRNDGGVPARPLVEAPDEVELTPDPKSVVLAPGTARAFELTYRPSAPGDWKDELIISTEGHEAVRLPMSASVTPPGGSAPIPAPPTILPAAPPLASGDFSEEPKTTNHIPPITDFQAVLITQNEIEISWKKPAPDAIGYQVEWRVLDLSSPTMKIRWQVWRNVKFTEANGVIVAHLENLPAGRLWYIRVRTLDPTDQLSEASPSVRIATLPNRGGFPWWLLALPGLVSAYYGARWWLRRANEEKQADAERISRLGKA